MLSKVTRPLVFVFVFVFVVAAVVRHVVHERNVVQARGVVVVDANRVV